MKVLLVGSGGREHALAWKIAQSPLLTALLIAPGNPGTAQIGQNVAIEATDVPALVAYAVDQAVDLVVVGPEAPLAVGLADACQAAGIRVFGPTAAAARIESSKIVAKQLMVEAGIPTAAAHSFADPAEAIGFVQQSGQAWVVKADGLAAGKGVVVAESVAETIAAIEALSATQAGQQILLEERLEGPEISLLALCDGERVLPLPPARDHKRLGDGDSGPNTGGMGAVAPVQLDPQTMALLVDQAIKPAIATLAARGTPFCGALYAGLMLTPHGPRVLEFNARFGDPETQVIMPLLEGDLLGTLLACAEGRLDPGMLAWRSGAAACVVIAAAGYPETPRRGDAIAGLAQETPQTIIFHAGTTQSGDQIVTAGGRVLGVTGFGPQLEQALAAAYLAVAQVQFAGMQYRHDIGATLKPAES
ncbi:MAG: phosphoribosylamine--glycine ligase [Roseiflexaceae bacterium]